MTVTRLILARHGQTDDNLNEVFQGQGGGPLNATGLREAGLLARRLRSYGITAVVSSDLERAVQTAQVAADALGLVPTQHRDLREIDVGAWTGVSYLDVRDRFPGEYQAWRQGIDVRRGEGETYGELAVRMMRAIDHVRATQTGHVLVVSHGAALRALGCAILGLVPPGLFKLGGMRNAAISIASVEEGSLRLSSWNDGAHLEG